MPRSQQGRAAPETPPERRQYMGRLRAAGPTGARGSLSRRTVLRGSSSALALPHLRLISNATATTRRGEPTLFGLWFSATRRLGNWLRPRRSHLTLPATDAGLTGVCRIRDVGSVLP